MEWYVCAVRWTDSNDVSIKVMSKVEKEWFDKTLQGKFFKENTRLVGTITADTRDAVMEKIFYGMRLDA